MILDDLQVRQLISILEYIRESESEDYEEMLECEPDMKDTHVYYVAEELAKSLGF